MDLERAIAIPGWTTPVQLEWLAQAASECSLIVELGSMRGRSARAMVDNTKGMMYCVDTWIVENNWGHSYDLFMQNMADVMDRIVMLRMLTTDGAAKIPNDLDMVFVDAGHSYGSVYQDILHYGPKLRVGGLFCGHDYNSEAGVSQAVDELLPDAINDPENIWWIRRPDGGFSFEKDHQ